VGRGGNYGRRRPKYFEKQAWFNKIGRTMRPDPKEEVQKERRSGRRYNNRKKGEGTIVTPNESIRKEPVEHARPNGKTAARSRGKKGRKERLRSDLGERHGI